MKPLVSIIICTHSRASVLPETLKSLLGQQLDGSFECEFLVVDNSPTGQMKAVLEPLYGSFGGRLRYLQEPVQGKSRALNLGINNARGEMIAFTDDDVIADPQWLLTLIRCLRERGCDGVGGRVLPVFPPETPQWIKDNPVKIAGGVVIYDYGDEEFRYDLTRYPFIGANYVFQRNVFATCGFFRTDLGPGTPIMGEDTEFIERLVEKGKVLYYCGKAVIRHPVDLSRIGLRTMAVWHTRLGRFAALREIEKKAKISVYYFGIPRYLWKGIIIDGITGVCSVFDRIRFLDAWRAFFRKVGMIQEYRARLNKTVDR